MSQNYACAVFAKRLHGDGAREIAAICCPYYPRRKRDLNFVRFHTPSTFRGYIHMFCYILGGRINVNLYPLFLTTLSGRA